MEYGALNQTRSIGNQVPYARLRILLRGKLPLPY